MADDHDEKPLRLSKSKLAKAMKDLDLCMLTTVGSYGHLHSRPMSNNRNVDWDGDTWFFSYADSSQVKEIQREPNVNVAYALPDDILFISVTGRGEISTDDKLKKEHWYDELERWFPKGPEDDAVVLIKVSAKYLYYWSKEGDGHLEL